MASHVVSLGRTPEADHISIEPPLEADLTQQLFRMLRADAILATETKTHFVLPLSEGDVLLQMKGQQAADQLGQNALLACGGEVIQFDSMAACANDWRVRRFQNVN